MSGKFHLIPLAAIVRTAVLSADGLYRYALTRDWREGDGRVAWVMLNPSIGDAKRDDHTISKAMGFSRLWGYSQLSIVNLFAYRATLPTDLHRASSTFDIVGPENAEHIAMEVRGARQVIVAWGAHATRYVQQKEALVAMLRRLTGDSLWCLGRSKNGEPLHPLILPYATERVPFKGSESK